MGDAPRVADRLRQHVPVGRGAGGVTDFFDVVLGQRACRAFSSDPVDDELVRRVLEAATHAPSAENRQPWVFVVVRDAARRAAIAEVNRRAWHGGARAFEEDRIPQALLADVERGVERGFEEAPVVVVVCGDTEGALPTTLASSVYPAAQNLCLAAGALGLGSAFTTLAVQDAAALAELLELPPSLRPMVVVPLGRPARPLGPPRRVPYAEKAFRERFGQPW